MHFIEPLKIISCPKLYLSVNQKLQGIKNITIKDIKKSNGDVISVIFKLLETKCKNTGRCLKIIFQYNKL